MLSIHYFASTREKIGIASENLEFEDGITTITELIAVLCDRHPGFKQANDIPNKLLVSVNQSLVDRTYKLNDGDEIAFFPPMTGG